MRPHTDRIRRRTHLGAAAVIVLGLVAALGLTGISSAAPAAPQPADDSVNEATAAAIGGTLLRDGPGLYPRVIRLQHSGADNGRILASVVTFVGDGSGPPDGVGAIYESTDGGSSFDQVGAVTDPEAADGQGLCCATLYELPRQIGDMPAGTLLWAASVGAADRPMALRIWKSNDLGRSWSYLSACATAQNTRGLWEPEFSIAADGSLVCHYADETDPAHSQKLVQVRSTDGVNWTDPTDTVAVPDPRHRPGMPMVRQLPNGDYFMTYEICALGGQYDCAVFHRTSEDGWHWGDPTQFGEQPQTVDGKYFTHTPTIAWSPSEGNPDGKILLIGRDLNNADGTVADDNRRTIFVNTENGAGPWYEIPAPVEVESPLENFCPNYSSPLLPSEDGTQVLEIASDFAEDGQCKAYFGTGSTIGTQDAAGVMDGGTYRFVNAQSGHCLSGAGRPQQAGANVQQQTCDGSGSQDWRAVEVENGDYQLVAGHSGHCLSVAGESRQPGANVQQWTCDNGENQDWRIVNVGRGYYKLISGDLCLAVTARLMTAGANVQQWTCNNRQHQVWRLESR